MTAKIHVERLWKWYAAAGERRSVLEEIDVSVEDQEFVCLLGPSGCGKTTVLNMIAGLVAPSQGAIRIDGRPVAGPGADRAYVFQEHALFPWMTVLDNVAFGLESRGLPLAEGRALARRLLGSLGLGDFCDYYPRRISGGMRQRVNLARALAVDADIILMDEPFAALDAQTRYTLHQELLAIWQTLRKTIVFVTHDIDEAMLLADRIVLLTARPARVKALVPIRLRRPRDEADLEYVALRKTVFRFVAEEMDRGLTTVSGELATILGRRS
jgi:NitT/TauT family transport system ATP-binding protein